MKWKDAFGDAMTELEAIRGLLAPVKRLDDSTVGLTALHGEVTQSRLKILEAVQMGVTGLREENRELRRRQERMISDLNDTRGELRQLLDLADVLRSQAVLQRAGEEPDAGAPGLTPPERPGPDIEPGSGIEPPGYGPLDAAPVYPPASSDTYFQGGTMDNHHPQEQPHPEQNAEPRDQDEDLELKQAIEASYQGTSTTTPKPAAPAAATVQPVAPQPAAPPAEESGGRDPQVTHGVLLLKAAGVASADLVAHRDTWEWLSALAVDHPHFRTPPGVEDVKEGRVQTVLSGRSLIALLIKLWETRSAAAPLEADWALATTAYNRIATELTGVRGEGQTIRIVLDDGLPHESSD
ncbi:hypothetical protein [Streptomyces californicus]|uniref:hypothetical protein n=1 Tax=Streptomyces californicus TaxID=67351 RepID=UPI00296E2E2D|nr:hypothetical protein [Streptomyces californicus]MDW4918897.1 hypothetical protein [Streptomyces californicus]